MLRSDDARALARYWNWSQIAPLAGWPHEYPLWLVDGLAHVQRALRDRADQDARRALELSRSSSPTW
jgi:hypothetical protein